MNSIQAAAPFASENVQGFLHTPQGSPSAGLVITHGAGGNCESPLLVAVANAFCLAGFAVLRCNLPSRQQRHFGPPSPANAQQDRAGLVQALNEIKKIAPGPALLGGHSYGGRQASMLAAEQPEVCSALLLLSYPLHPPGKPQQKRTEHLPRVRVPSLFVHGTQDPFGSIEELTEAIGLIPAPHRLSVIQDAGHDLAKGKFDVDGRVVREFSEVSGG